MSLIWDSVRVVMIIVSSVCSKLEMLVIALCLRSLLTSNKCMTPVVVAFKSLSNAIVD